MTTGRVLVELGTRLYHATAAVRCPRSRRRRLKVVVLAPFDKQVDQHRPRTLAIVVGHVIVDLGGKVQQQIPRISRNRSLVVLLK